MKTRIIPVTMIVQNCCLMWCDATRKGVVIDPGGDHADILSAIDQENVSVEKILITHGHIDHAGNAAALSRALGAPIWGPHKDDQFLIDALPTQAAMYGISGAEAFTPALWLNEGDSITFGDEVLTVIHAPGHTPGHLVYFNERSRFAVVGDVLFSGTIGRTDLPRGNFEDLTASIKNKLFVLGDDVRFLPGHGRSGTFGDERLHNPFVGINAGGVKGE
ncbi:MAG: MBL fold metallo-hydrolase [Burkholderiales bacterium]|nr:MBL fold metallo-hydrolase [Burkholderiales bacterium]